MHQKTSERTAATSYSAFEEQREMPTTGLYVHVGPAALLFSPSAKVRTEGITIPGATVNIRNEETDIVELGYQRGRSACRWRWAARR